MFVDEEFGELVADCGQCPGDGGVGGTDTDREGVDEQARDAVGSAMFIRPNNTVPNTTSSRPLNVAKTRAQARWKIVAALTPSVRAASRT